ncbi:nucleotide exchange factor GrpE [Micrococcus sp.]|uniref:nucleotide exchange factor GrpE n=1 Tax=Micrococcus sp. TaxID=1271 RepID=UPI002A9188CF|nr:nucleotide exchange factor GrpE [Micrococcus sp.]MDY6055245.1 nucleotide exchange factor GrpE [Micrococcus sp.]
MSENENRDAVPQEGPGAEEPVIRDRRRIDPETGQARPTAETAAQEASSAAEQAEQPQAEGDALSQAQRILDDAGQDAAAAAAPGREAELEEDLRRLQAEYVNYKRRVDRDRDLAKDQGVLSAVAALMPVLDDLDAARAAGDLAEGPFAAIAAKLDAALAGLGLVREDQEALVGTEFDPARHEAVMRQPSADVPAEHIVQVFRNGYHRQGRVLRAAQVMVSAGDE